MAAFPGFGAAAAPAAGFGGFGGFGAAAPAAAAPPAAVFTGFGAAPAAPATGGFSGFGAPAAAPAAPAFGAFGAPAAAPAAPAFGAFGAPAAAPAAAAPAFGAFGAAAPAAVAPAFGAFGAPAAAPPAAAPPGFGGPGFGGAFAGFGTAPLPTAGAFNFSNTGTAFAVGASAPTEPEDEQDRVITRLVRLLPKLANGQLAEVGTRRPLSELLKLLNLMRKAEGTVEGDARLLEGYALRVILRNVHRPNESAPPRKLMSEFEWEEAYVRGGDALGSMVDNITNPPLALMPVPVDGFGGLVERVRMQDGALNTQSEVAGLYNLRLDMMREKAAATRERITAVRTRHAVLAHKLLRCGKKVDLLIIAMTKTSVSRPEQELLSSLRAQLYELHNAQALQPRLDEALHTLRAREEAASSAAAVAAAEKGQRGEGDAAGGGLVTGALAAHITGLERAAEKLHEGVMALFTNLKAQASNVAIAEEELKAVIRPALAEAAGVGGAAVRRGVVAMDDTDEW